ncbi:hypothetical protein [Aquisalimonas asiatica]|uniref:Uncharacterized protein n=1 Tax=Aquisalimonas asiatica TaxID=406100 RepID=A0A1H8TKH5_9GAMM|nr:hypothetical protein [Aquisalimonas asiatica]SEO91286.1 hypothetical protein SAMN04488052_104263 [Aquisalimonas asiatica]
MDENQHKTGARRRGILITAAVLAGISLGVYLIFILLQVGL